MSALEEIEEFCEEVGGYVEVYDSNDVLLDGHFTRQELRKLVNIMEKLSYEED